MSDLYWLSEEQIAKLKSFFLKSHGKPHLDDRRVMSSIIFINRNGLRERNAPSEYGPHKTLYKSLETLEREGYRGYDADWYREAFEKRGAKHASRREKAAR